MFRNSKWQSRAEEKLEAAVHSQAMRKYDHRKYIILKMSFDHINTGILA